MCTLLCILDGFGLNPDTEANAVKLAKTPNFNRLWKTYPHSTLITFGERVGLPAGQMGNSEVGHMNIGAGRVVEQWLVRIFRELRNDLLPENSAYNKFLSETKNSRTIHFYGLCSNGGVHSHMDHLILLLKRLRQDSNATFLLHLITDGRDTAPHTSLEYVAKVQKEISSIPNTRIATLSGRFFAMDRDKRWDRVKKAYDLYTGHYTTVETNPLAALKKSHQNDLTDEFVEPIACSDFASSLDPNDAAVFFNFREDRMRELVFALAGDNFDGFSEREFRFQKERVLCFTEYDKNLGLPFLFAPQSLKNHIGEAVANAGKKQIRLAETEKYPHVTYFLNGGIEVPYEGEERFMTPSPRDVKTYDLKPEMSGYEVARKAKEAIESGKYDLIVVNFANCDMVGHTGNIPAAIKAVETVDTCLGELAEAIERGNGNGIILADHGNAELMINYETGNPHTAHTTFPVPCIALGVDKKSHFLFDDGALCDVAPTLLELLKIKQPSEMTGTSLLREQLR